MLGKLDMKCVIPLMFMLQERARLQVCWVPEDAAPRKQLCGP